MMRLEWRAPAMLNYLLFIATIGGIYGAAGAQPQPDLGRGRDGQSGPRRLLRRRRLCLGAADDRRTSRRSPSAGCWRWWPAAWPGWSSTLSTTRLREDYLAIVTLGFAEVVRLVAANEIWLTRGTDGISGIPGPVEGGAGPGLQRRLLPDRGRGCSRSSSSWCAASTARPTAARCAPSARTPRWRRSPASPCCASRPGLRAVGRRSRASPARSTAISRPTSRPTSSCR